MVDIPNEIQDLGFHVQKKLDQSYLPSISYDSYKSIKETAGSRYFHGNLYVPDDLETFLL